MVIPIFDQPRRVADVVAGVAAHGLPILIVDDGSGPVTRAVLADLATRFASVEVVRHERNRGKGAALKHGFARAAERGCTHAVHLDADGQHDPADVPRFLAACAQQPDAMVLGVPVFDDTAPAVRLYGRQLSRAIVWGVTLSTAIADPLCGYRAFPVSAFLELARGTGDHMDCEPELAVRFARDGYPVVGVPTRVRYFADGASHFDFLRDNLRLVRLYLRLVGSLPRFALGRARRSPAVAGVPQRG